jgi:hypothetical protein
VSLRQSLPTNINSVSPAYREKKFAMVTSPAARTAFIHSSNSKYRDGPAGDLAADHDMKPSHLEALPLEQNIQEESHLMDP